PSLAALKKAREMGIRVGVLQLQTLWPFPTRIVQTLAARAKLILIPELSSGQLKSEIQKYCAGKNLVSINKLGGISIQPEDILAFLAKEPE
ncbi:MAG TPA: 2-oxoacid:acceptor oxidoreductase subunit alpha, partial [Atribacterota bacterium]|nr:2-oxoacid:acceptor oxidoreductase subunit alpha [Atribacterota bacterium]